MRTASRHYRLDPPAVRSEWFIMEGADGLRRTARSADMGENPAENPLFPASLRRGELAPASNPPRSASAFLFLGPGVPGSRGVRPTTTGSAAIRRIPASLGTLPRSGARVLPLGPIDIQDFQAGYVLVHEVLC